MKVLLIATALTFASLTAYAAGQDRVTGVVEVNQPDCAECPPIITLVDGNARTLVSAPHTVLAKIARKQGKPVTIEGTLESYKNEKTGVTKHIIAVAENK